MIRFTSFSGLKCFWDNQQHWVLDVQFGEEACRTRRDHSVENLALIRRVALNVLRHNGPPQDSIRQRKIRAALNDDYRLNLLIGYANPGYYIARLPWGSPLPLTG